MHEPHFLFVYVRRIAREDPKRSARRSSACGGVGSGRSPAGSPADRPFVGDHGQEVNDGARDADLAPVSTSVPPPGWSTAQPDQQPDRRSSPRTPPGARQLIAAAAGVALAAVAAFLVLGSPGNRLTDPIAQAATLSSNSAGYRIHTSLRITSSTLSAPITADGRGIVDVQDRASSLSLAMDLGNEPQVIQALGSSTIRLEMIVDGTAVYAKLPDALAARLPMAGKQWIKVDLGKLGGVPGLSSLQSDPTASDPGQILKWLTSVSDSVFTEGHQIVDGVETTHYQAQLSLDRLADSMPAADRGAVQKALALLEQTTQTHDFPVDVWIDAHQLVRRVAITISLVLPNGATMQELETVDLSHYGPQPRPAAPPAYEVYSAS